MARKFLVNLDMALNQVKNALFDFVAGNPGSPAEGQHWYNSTAKRWKYRNDSATLTPWTDADALVGDITGLPGATTIAAGVIVNADVNASAAIAYSKLNLAASIVSADIVDGTITSTDIADNTIVNADINSAAAIAYSKLNLASSIVSADIVDGTIVNGDINASAAIAYSKLNLGSSIVSADIVDGTIVNGDINASAAIALSKLATDPLARANHTGSQLASTISDFNTAVRLNRLDQMAAPTASVAMGSQKITGLLDPTLAQDAATKNYVDAAIAGLSWKDSVRVATTANITLSGEQTIDGILTDADYVLVKSQTLSKENGIYVTAPGAWSRRSDMDSGVEIAGAAVFVEEGTLNNTTAWVVTEPDSLDLSGFVLGVGAITFSQFSGNGSYTAGGGIGLSGATFSVAAGTGLSQDADGLSADTAVLVRKYAVDCAASTSTTVTHNLNTNDVTVEVYDTSTKETVIVDVVRTSVNVVTVTFASAPSAAAYRIVVHG